MGIIHKQRHEWLPLSMGPDDGMGVSGWHRAQRAWRVGTYYRQHELGE